MSSDLSSRIAAADAQLVAREQRVRQRWLALREHVHEAVRPQRIALPLLGGAALILLVRVLGRGRHSKRGTVERSSRSARPRVGWIRLLAFALPLLPPEWRERLQPSSIAALVLNSVRSTSQVHSAPPRTVDAVDLSRYAGTWHEIARLPNRYERECVGQPSATYTPGFDGIAVTNRCSTRNGQMRVSQGLARVVPGSAGACLKVTFVPSWLRWLDAAWADYWILDLDADYRVALVGTPRRDAMWLLAREPVLDDAQRERLLRIAAERGYDVQRLQFS